MLTIRDVPGIRVGHWTDEAGRTGCTVIIAPEGTRGACPTVRATAHGAIGWEEYRGWAATDVVVWGLVETVADDAVTPELRSDLLRAAHWRAAALWRSARTIASKSVTGGLL